METIDVPITAIISLLLGCVILGFAASDISLFEESEIAIVSDNSAYTTESERLVTRYLETENYEKRNFGRLWELTNENYGSRAPYLLLEGVQNYIENSKEKKRLDEAYLLKGYILESMGLENKAYQSYKTALRSNPDLEAAKNSIDRYENAN